MTRNDNIGHPCLLLERVDLRCCTSTKFRASLVLAIVVIPAPRVYIKIVVATDTQHFPILRRRQVVTTINRTGHPCHVLGMSRC